MASVLGLLYGTLFRQGVSSEANVARPFVVSPPAAPALTEAAVATVEKPAPPVPIASPLPPKTDDALAFTAGTRPSVENSHPDTTPTPAEAKIIGNRNKKVFHRAGCSSLANMYERNQRNFADAYEALEAGYQPCGKCNPSQVVDAKGKDSPN